MIEIQNRWGTYFLVDSFGQITEAFPTIQALENHIKLMLIAVQNYNGKKYLEESSYIDDEPIDYSARYYHE